eukprot:1253242-Pleurochrysis_carterae.AAC.2
MRGRARRARKQVYRQRKTEWAGGDERARLKLRRREEAQAQAHTCVRGHRARHARGARKQHRDLPHLHRTRSRICGHLKLRRHSFDAPRFG